MDQRLKRRSEKKAYKNNKSKSFHFTKREQPLAAKVIVKEKKNEIITNIYGKNIRVFI